MKLALKPIVEQLKAGGCRNAAGLLEFAALKSVPAMLPAYFAVPTDEDASPNTLSGGRDQKVGNRFSVFVVFDASRRNVDAVADDLKAETDRVKAALVGWTHPEASTAVDYAGGRLFDITNGAVTWQLRFATSHHLRKAS